MTLIRPELRAAAQEWRDVLVGVGVALVGVWAALAAGGILALVGWVAVAVGIALAAAGVQRKRFRRGEGDGPGYVTVTEAQVTYFGPLTGGTAAFDLLVAVNLDGMGKPAHWILVQETHENLAIPITAAGADRLFDVFEQLPGLNVKAMLSAVENPEPRIMPIWRKDADTDETVHLLR